MLLWCMGVPHQSSVQSVLTSLNLSVRSHLALHVHQRDKMSILGPWFALTVDAVAMPPMISAALHMARSAIGVKKGSL